MNMTTTEYLEGYRKEAQLNDETESINSQILLAT